MPAAIAWLSPRAFASAEEASLVLQCAPTEDEASALAAHLEAGRPAEALSEAEQFVLALANTPRAEARLRALIARHVAEEKQQEARKARARAVVGGGLRGVIGVGYRVAPRAAQQEGAGIRCPRVRA